SKQTLMNQMKQIGKTLNKTEEFIRFERDQTVFQSFVISKKDEHHEDDTNVDDFKLIHYHLKNIMNLNIKHMTFSEENMTTIKNAILQLASILQGKEVQSHSMYEDELRTLLDVFWSSPHPAYKEDESELPHELTLLYELITVFYIVKQLNAQKRPLSKE